MSKITKEQRDQWYRQATHLREVARQFKLLLTIAGWIVLATAAFTFCFALMAWQVVPGIVAAGLLVLQGLILLWAGEYVEALANVVIANLDTTLIEEGEDRSTESRDPPWKGGQDSAS